MRLREIKFLVTIFATLMIISGCTQSQTGYKDIGISNINISEKDSEVYGYLEKNNRVIDVEELDNFVDLSIIDSDLDGKEIFFTGEYHGT